MKQDDAFDVRRFSVIRGRVGRRLCAIGLCATLLAVGTESATCAQPHRDDVPCQSVGDDARCTKPVGRTGPKSMPVDMPEFDIADQRLSTFLAWVALRTHHKLIYDDPESAALAHHVRLRGSIAGLSPEVALEAVLSTTSLRLHRSHDNSIHIGRAEAIDSTTASRPIR